MISCSNKHEEIIYDKGRCPLCEALDEIEEMQKKIEYLENKE